MPNKTIIGFLLLTIVSASIIYIAMQEQGVKMRVDNDKTTFYVIENNRWVISGEEYLSIYSGTSKLNRNISGIKIEQFIDNVKNILTIVKTTPYQRGPIIIQTYTFYGSINDKEIFPVSHNVEVLNAKGMFLRYEVKRLVYSGQRYKLTNETKLYFGRNMIVNLNPDYRWAWVYAGGSMAAQYDILTNDEYYQFRLYDPGEATNTTLYINGSSIDRNIETGDPANITAIVNVTGLQVCLSINHTDFGENFTCDTTSVTYIWNNVNNSLNALNDSSIEKNLTYTEAENQTAWIQLNHYDNVTKAIADFKGYDNLGSYLHDVEIDVGNDSYTDLIFYGDFGIISSNIINESDFNASQSSIENEWDGGTLTEYIGETKIEYIRVPGNINATNAVFNITADPNGNATRVLLTPDWRSPKYWGGYNLTAVGRCWAPVGGMIGDRYYQIGGRCLTYESGEYNNTIYYDISSDSMSTDEQLPYNMHSGCAISYDNDTDGLSEEIYIIGGKNSTDNPISTVYKYDGTIFTSLTSMPDSRANTACVLVGDIIYVFGGANATVNKYSITGNSWSNGGNLASGTHGLMLQAAQLNSTHILVWGGYGGTGMDDIDYYDMVTDTSTDMGEDMYANGGIGISFKKSDGEYAVYHVSGYCVHASDCGVNSGWIKNIWEYTDAGFVKVSTDFDWDADWPDWIMYYDDIYQVGQSFGIYEGVLYASPNTVTGYESMIFRLKFFPQDPYIIIGTGNVSWNYAGGMTSYEERSSDAQGGDQINQQINNFATEINNYIYDDCITSSYCDVPIYIVSTSAGNLTISNLNITWTVNDLDLNITAIQTYLDGQPVGKVDIPIRIESTNGGIIEISDIKIDYYGSGTYNVTGFTLGNESYDASSDEQILHIYYSKFEVKLPKNVPYFEMILKNATQDNITPYGQTSTIPIFNISSKAYDKAMNVSIKLNSSLDSCFKINISNTNASNGYTISTNKYDYATNLSVGNYSQLWAFGYANDCNYTLIGKRWLAPIFIFESKCYDCM